MNSHPFKSAKPVVADCIDGLSKGRMARGDTECKEILLKMYRALLKIDPHAKGYISANMSLAGIAIGLFTQLDEICLEVRNERSSDSVKALSRMCEGNAEKMVALVKACAVGIVPVKDVAEGIKRNMLRQESTLDVDGSIRALQVALPNYKKVVPEIAGDATTAPVAVAQPGG